MDTETLLTYIAAYCQRNGIAESTLARRTVNDGKAIKRLRAGGRMWPENIKKITDYMAGVNGKAIKVRRRA